jgi:hypothetical protein
MKAFISALAVFVCLSGLGFAAPAESPAADDAVYDGQVYHIFFHSLILEPELAFQSETAQGYDDWMTTRTEFKRILDKLYENNFALADIEYVRDCKLNKTPFYFYKNKKPLIISVDDVNYYEYMKNDGFANRLVVDEEGRVATEVTTVSGDTVVDYEGDVMPVVDGFVAEHPDFSYNGAKGVVAVTGYQGVFGYRITTEKGDELVEDKKAATRVADALKSSGWKIACHSYGHSLDFKDGSITKEKLVGDISKWEKLIAPVTGKTDIFVSPFGIMLSGERFAYLSAKGYDIYCAVGKNMNISLNGGCMITERLNFDGFTMRNYPSRITSRFFDVKDIIDEKRPSA